MTKSSSTKRPTHQQPASSQPAASSQQPASSQPAASSQQPAASSQQPAASSRQPEGMGAGIVLTHKTLINRWPKSVVWLQWGTWSPGPSTKGALELAMSSSALWQHRRMGACSCLLFLAFVLKPASYLTIKLSGQKASKPFGQQAITRNS